MSGALFYLPLLFSLSVARIISISVVVCSTQLRPGNFEAFGRFAMYSNRDVVGRFNATISFDATAYLGPCEKCSGETVVFAVVPYSTLKRLETIEALNDLSSNDVCLWADGTGGPPDFLHELALHSQPLNHTTFINYVTPTQSFPVLQTDLYDVLLAVCGSQNAPASLVGEITLLNPFGYLSGDTYPMLTVSGRQFSFIATCAYGLLLCAWVGLLYWHWSTAISLQKWYIPTVLLICALEESCYYFSWNSLNDSGSPSRLTLTAVLVLNALRGTLSRILLLVISMGYGITIPRLKAKVCIGVLGSAYFACNFAYTFALHSRYWYIIRLNVVQLVLITMPVSAVNAAFYLWTFMELTKTVGKLKREQQVVKLQVFQRLVLLISLSLLFALLWFFIESYYRFMQDWEDYWQIAWRFDAAWHIVFYILLLGVLLLWRPTDRSKSLAFTLELRDIDDVSKSEVQRQPQIELRKYQIGYEGESS